jgi:hypothetical protein
MQVYYPGQSVSGSLQLVLKEPKWYQYAAVSLTGKGKLAGVKLIPEDMETTQ